MSASLVEEDLTVLEHLDFEPACEMRRHDDATATAKWYIVTNDCPRCGDSKRLFCEDCKTFAEECNGGTVRCVPCTTRRIIRISRIEPLS